MNRTLQKNFFLWRYVFRFILHGVQIILTLTAFQTIFFFLVHDGSDGLLATQAPVFLFKKSLLVSGVVLYAVLIANVFFFIWKIPYMKNRKATLFL